MGRMLSPESSSSRGTRIVHRSRRHVPQRNEQGVKRYLFDFYTIAGLVEDIGAVYRNLNLRPIWAKSNLMLLLDPCLTVFAKVPSSRSAVLNFTGMLIHEATHLYFSKKENTHISKKIKIIENS
ncbi:unnamed protein product [Gongylonema pulchrum]|uniref:INTS5_N domain-containing protein n=1 Tax=Gongylonema pulchrum TaxID=637853 RepID=A0A183DYN3_9BILA|nr:unnamed protein product [Gongylonema pulchrum]